MKSCLNCKHQPEWGEWRQISDYKARIGSCKWMLKNPLPDCMRLREEPITQFSDNSGIHKNCPTWEPEL